MNGSQRINDLRGSSRDRRRRRQWLLDTYGDGETCLCVHCEGTLDDHSLTVDRIVPASQGGRYTRGNVQPACLACNVLRGDNDYVPVYPDCELLTAKQLEEQDADAESYATPI